MWHHVLYWIRYSFFTTGTHGMHACSGGKFFLLVFFLKSCTLYYQVNKEKSVGFEMAP